MPGAVYVPAALTDLSVDVQLATVARGDLLYRGASKWNNLGLAGRTAGDVLSLSDLGGGVLEPRWATPTPGSTDHGALTGLGDDDHPQYLNTTRGDLRYYTQSQLDTALAGKSDVGHNHDSRYYTETEVDSFLSGKSDTGHTHAHSALTGLTSGDDHTQYALADKSRPSVWVSAADLAARSLADLGTRVHSALTGLAADDHTQYHNDARGDARYSLLGHNHAISGLTGVAWSSSAQGDVYYRSSGGNLVNLAPAPAASGYFFQSGGAGANPAWAIPDHGSIGGLADDDHTQYVLAAGGRTITGQQRLSFVGSASNDVTQDAVRIQPSGALAANWRPWAVYLTSAATSPHLYVSKTGELVCTGNPFYLNSSGSISLRPRGASNDGCLVDLGTGGQVQFTSAAGSSASSYFQYSASYSGFSGVPAKIVSWGVGAPNSYTEKAALDKDGHLLLAGHLGVGNSAAATTLGTVVKKVQIYDAAGASLGYVPVYDAIT